MEAQRQRERIKLIEIERKKREQREQANAGVLSKATDNSNSNPTATTPNNAKPYANLKRVNIKTPTNNNKAENADLLPPLDSKKLKRKPKFKKYLVDENNLEISSQKNPTPSSVSGIILEENPPSRNYKARSPANEPINEKENQKPVSQLANHHHQHPNTTTPHPQPQEPPGKPEPVKPEPVNKPDNESDKKVTTTTNKKPTATTRKDEMMANKLRRQISNASHVSEKYEFIKTLGDGNFAVVKQARHKLTDHEYAIKIIDKSKMKGKENMIENEIYIMKSCNHPNIVKLYEEFETKDEVYLVTDLVKVSKRTK